jgi:hypothetical protein
MSGSSLRSPRERRGHRQCDRTPLNDQGYRVTPLFGPAFSRAIRNCTCCAVRDACGDWLAKHTDTVMTPPNFCPNSDLLWDLLCDPAVGNRPA